MGALQKFQDNFRGLGEYRKIYLSFLGVTLITAAADIVASFLDAAIGGQLIGPLALSASFAALPISLAFSTLGNLFVGGSIRASHALGEDDASLASAYFKKSMTWGLVVSLALSVLLVACGDAMAQFLGGGKDEAIIVAGGDYLKGFAFSGIPMTLILVLTGFTRIDGSKNIPAVSIVLISIVDLVLDFAFAPLWGIFGLALASTIAYFLGFIPFIWYFLKPNRVLRMHNAAGKSVSILAIVKTGFPLAFSRACSMANISVLGILCFGMMGENGLLIVNVREQALNIALAFVYAFAQSAVPNLGKYHGASDLKGQRSMMITAFTYGLAMSVGLCVLFILLSGSIANFMGVATDDFVFPYVQAAVALAGFNVILKTATTSSAIFYQVTGREGVALFIHVLDTVAVIIPIELIMFLTGDITNLWVAAIIADAVVLLAILVMNKVKQKYGLFSKAGLERRASDRENR